LGADALQLAEGRSIRGTVRSSLDGKPLAGAAVSVSSPRRSAVTDASGRYELKSLPDKFFLRIRAEGHAPYLKSLRLRAGDSSAAVQDVTLKPVAVVRGRVLGMDNVPVPDVEVKGGLQPVHTDASGRFEVQSAQFTRPPRLRARKAGFARSFSEPLTLEPGKVLSDVVIRMGRGGRVSGRVVDPEGAPVTRNVRIHLKPLDGDPLGQESVSPLTDGSFR